MMTRFTAFLAAFIALLCVLALAAGTQASAGTSRPGTAAQHSALVEHEGRTAGGPRTWHVLIGGQAEHQAVQAEGYYPHVITIDAGDTVTWTLNTDELHSVTFTGTCEKASCVPKCFPISDISPCGPPRYNGVTAVDSSGRMIVPGYNWDNAFRHGGTTYSLTFTRPGVDVYFDLSVPGMRGVVVVHPAGTPYPFTQAQYSTQARQQLKADLAAGKEAKEGFRPVTTATRADGTHLYHVALGTNPPERAGLALSPASGSGVRGRARLNEPGAGSSPKPAITVRVRLSGLVPGSVHAMQILPGVCGAPAPTTGLLFSGIFVPPAFTLNSVTAGPDGTATSTTVLTEPPNNSAAGLLRIPSTGWFVNVAAGPAADNGAISDACGNVVYHNAAVMRYGPASLHMRVGDTVTWADHSANEVHGVTFLAGTPLPPIPDWYFSTPTPGTTYDGSTFFNSSPLYMADAPGRDHSLTLTLTKAGRFGYLDVADTILGMRGNLIVRPSP
jgi:plastocyanin